MRQDEFESFKGELKQLCATLGKAYTDQLGQAYWRALKDVDLSEIEAHVERIILNATAETKFPKPVQLRSTPAPRAEFADPSLREMELRSMRNLEELRRSDPAEWLNRMKGRRAADYAEQFGVHNIWFDFDENCWRHHA